MINLEIQMKLHLRKLILKILKVLIAWTLNQLIKSIKWKKELWTISIKIFKRVQRLLAIMNSIKYHYRIVELRGSPLLNIMSNRYKHQKIERPIPSFSNIELWIKEILMTYWISETMMMNALKTFSAIKGQEESWFMMKMLFLIQYLWKTIR